MCNALTVTKRESAPLPERLCERIAYCAILLTVYEADYSVVVAQSEGADHRYYRTPEMQNILLQNVVGHAVRKAKNFAGSATDAILSGHQVLINLMSDFVLDKTKATAEGHQWESYTLEHIANNARFAAGGQCDQCAGLLVGYSCSLTLPCRDVFQVTTNDRKIIEVAMRNHTTHPQGRDPHNLNKYIWRFIALSTAQPRVIHIEATSEQEARQQSPAGCVMVFAARIRQEVRHD
ncbi:host cell division inhibitor Icd-like protein [Escherichia coli]|nr:host cell division inhibitor Icd-like protein [Escherichia coli]